MGRTNIQDWQVPSLKGLFIDVGAEATFNTAIWQNFAVTSSFAPCTQVSSTTCRYVYGQVSVGWAGWLAGWQLKLLSNHLSEKLELVDSQEHLKK